MSIHDRDGNLAEKLQPAVTTLRIIVVALASGVLFFAAVAGFMRLSGPAEPDGAASNLLTFMAIGVAPIAFIASRLVPALMVRVARRQIAAGNFGQFQNASAAGPNSVIGGLGDAGRYCVVYQTKTIVGAAMIEGAAFLSLVAYLLEGNPIALGLGIGLAVAIVAMFPSPPRVANWIEQQLRLMDDEKMLAR